MACTPENLLACKKYRETHKEKRKQIIHDYYIRNKEKINKISSRTLFKKYKTYS
jgi:hypothetical protein